jgi:hypothetical protein
MVFSVLDAEYDSAAAAAVVVVRVGIVGDDLAGNGRNGDYEAASPATAVAAAVVATLRTERDIPSRRSAT